MGIALCSPCFEYRCSPYNKTLSSSKCSFMFREILPEAQRQDLIQKAMEKLLPPAPVLQEGAPVPEGGEVPAPAPVPTRELTLEELGWQTIVFDSDFKIGDASKGLGFLASAGPLTNTTRFQVDTATEKNTVRIGCPDLLN